MTKDSHEPHWDVFLSHNSADKARVRRLAKELRDQGLQVWFDEDTIPAGASITLAVEDGIERSRMMILCISPDFLANEWPQTERAAKQFADPANRNRSILPVMFRRCELPSLLAHLRYVSYLRHTKAALAEIVQAVPTGSRPPPPPSKVRELLDAAKDAERQQDLAQAVSLARKAFSLAEQDDDGERSVVDRCRASMRLSRYLLRLGETPDHAWELADASADPTLLEAYPDVLFNALCAKAEAAIMTRRFSVAEGAVEAAAALQEDANDRRIVEQIRGLLALYTEQTHDAIRHFETARLSFSASLNNEPDPSDRQVARLGLAACLTNLGVAHRQAGRLVDALAALTEAADLYHQLHATVDESAARRLAAACHFDDRQWQSGATQLDAAEQLARASQNDAALIDILELRARAAATLERNEDALKALIEATSLAGDQPASRRRRLLQMTATIHSAMGDASAAKRSLDIAYVLAGDDAYAILDIEHQRRNLQLGNTRIMNEPAPDEIVSLITEQITAERVDTRRAELMRRLGSAHLSRRELDKATKWFQRTLGTARDTNALHLVVDAQIGLAQVAIRRDQDDLAESELTSAMTAADGLPHWAAHASIPTLQALLLARRGDFRGALRLLDSAHEIAFDYNLHEEMSWIEDQRQDVREWLSLTSFPTHDLADLASEMRRLESWFPEEQRELRRLWWYWRGDEVMRNLRISGQAGALIVTDDANEVADLSESLVALFDLTTFTSESAFADREPVHGFVPIPKNLDFPYVNFVYMMDNPDAAPK
ncbi:MAG: TIR domain-containing protein [Candidatus Nanopelagicales bacterium]